MAAVVHRKTPELNCSSPKQHTIQIIVVTSTWPQEQATLLIIIKAKKLIVNQLFTLACVYLQQSGLVGSVHRDECSTIKFMPDN